jgi:two-component system, OmpR family, copper resistance phosphate regulon response regulator CusR
VRVLVVEDEPHLRSSLELGLIEAGFSAEACGRGDEALRLAMERVYDVVLLDLSLPGMSGIDVLTSLRKAGRSTAVLVLTARDRVEDRVHGLDAGADDYLTKPFAFPELLARIRALMRRGAPENTSIEVADLRIELLSRRVHRGEDKIDLTPKEFSLLALLARHAGQVVTRTMISQHVWEMDYDSFTNVIDVYIRCLRRKIDEGRDLKLIHTQRGIGYLLGVKP